MSVEMKNEPLPKGPEMCSERSNQKAMPGDLWIPVAQGSMNQFNA